GLVEVAVCLLADDESSPCTAAAATTAMRQAGTRTRTARRHVSRGKTRRAWGSPSSRTRSRTDAGVSLGSARNSRTSSSNSRSKSTVSDAGIAHHLLESFQCAAQPRRTCRPADPEQPGRGRPVQLEQHAQRDDLSLGRSQLLQRGCERTFPPRRLDDPVELARVTILATGAPLLRPEVIERDAACDPAQPRTRGPPPRVEAALRAERVLERVAGQIFREAPVPGEEEEVAMHRIELGLRNSGERRPGEPESRQGRRHRVHVLHTPQRAWIVTREL